MFTIGQFARLASVSIRMLRHWHGIDLLVPEAVGDGSGYRYYTASQLPLANRIVALRGLGFGLEEIRTLVSDISVDELDRLLVQRRKTLAEELQLRTEQLNDVGVRLNALRRYGTLPDYEITVRALPELRIAAIRSPIPGFGWDNVRPVVRAAYPRLRETLSGASIETRSGGHTEACSMRSPGIAPTSVRARAVSTSSTRVTQWTATGRPRVWASAIR